MQVFYGNLAELGNNVKIGNKVQFGSYNFVAALVFI